MSDDEFVITYRVRGPLEEVHARAGAIAVEQSHEFPTAYAAEYTHRSLGRVREVREVADDLADVSIVYPEALAGHNVSQFLVMLFGNTSLLPGIQVTDISYPRTWLAEQPGPRFGVTGLRALLGGVQGPLLASALKPVGLTTEDLAALAYELAAGGADIVKDDQGLSDQDWAPGLERVRASAAAIRRANEETGHRTLYFPTFSPTRDYRDELAALADAGATGILAMPGVDGFQLLRDLSTDPDIALPVLAHPSFLGAFVADGTHGIAPDVLFGELLRILGSDIAVFPSYGGRFSFDREQCARIADRARRPLGELAAQMPSPGGGMSLERVPELVEFYGPDTVLLIGGELHRDRAPRAAVREFRSVVGR